MADILQRKDLGRQADLRFLPLRPCCNNRFKEYKNVKVNGNETDDGMASRGVHPGARFDIITMDGRTECWENVVHNATLDTVGGMSNTSSSFVNASYH
jgi:hypothetical protein